MLAYTMSEQRGDLDLLMFRLAKALEIRGWTTAGVVQVNSEREDQHPCDMDVLVLPNGPTLRISQTLGAGAKGCRLDPHALETAVAEVQRRLNSDVDVLFINKFGKHEAEGRGFRDVIAAAIESGIPVICGVNGLNLDAFLAFADGFAHQVKSDVAALEVWLKQARLEISEVA